MDQTECAWRIHNIHTRGDIVYTDDASVDAFNTLEDHVNSSRVIHSVDVQRTIQLHQVA